MTEVSALRDGDGNLGGGVAGVGEVDGDQPVAGLGAAMGKTLSMVRSGSPCRHRPNRRRTRRDRGGRRPARAVFRRPVAGESRPDRSCPRDPPSRTLAVCGVGGGIVGAQSGGEGGVAGEIAQHPEDIGGLGAVVDGRDGLGERLAGAYAGAGGLGQCQRGAAGFERFERLLAAAAVFRARGCP